MPTGITLIMFQKSKAKVVVREAMPPNQQLVRKVERDQLKENATGTFLKWGERVTERMCCKHGSVHVTVKYLGSKGLRANPVLVVGVEVGEE